MESDDLYIYTLALLIVSLMILRKIKLRSSSASLGFNFCAVRGGNISTLYILYVLLTINEIIRKVLSIIPSTEQVVHGDGPFLLPDINDVNELLVSDI